MNVLIGFISIEKITNNVKLLSISLSVKILKQYKKEFQDHLKGGYLFDSQRSNQVTTRGVQHIVDNYATRLNMPDLTCHALRHTCLHNLVKAGVSLSTVAEIQDCRLFESG
jgi:integrase/recombinase XerC/integrase/recombinase XerD